jgi:predicted N-formylglutamate amidohydrolase
LKGSGKYDIIRSTVLIYPMKPLPRFVLTCEHATNTIPPAYQERFRTDRVVTGPWGRQKIGVLLNDHWGWDIGAFEVAKFLQHQLHVPLHAFPVSRLFIEGNRYRRTSLFSPLMVDVSEQEKERLRTRYWVPHLRNIQRDVETRMKKYGQVIQMSIHSYTSAHNGAARNGDIGILFDPTRASEKQFAHRLQKELQHRLPDLRVRRNYPYAGSSEGLSKYFRKQFPDNRYTAVEIELNNKYLVNDTPMRQEIKRALAESLAACF